MADPHAIHQAAEQFKFLKHRFLRPLLEMGEALAEASEAILAGAVGEAERRRDQLGLELTRLGEAVAQKRAEVKVAFDAISHDHDAAVQALHTEYAAQRDLLEAQHQASLNARLIELAELETKRDALLREIEDGSRRRDEGLAAHQQALAATTAAETRTLQDLKVQQQQLRQSITDLEGRLKALRGAVQSESRRLRDLAEQASGESG